MVTPAQVGGENEGGAQGVDLRHEDMGLAGPEGGLESSRGRREVSRRRGSYHVGVARGVQGDSIGDVIATSAEKGGVDEGGPRGIQLHDEGISRGKDEVGAAEGGLIGSGAGREVAG